MSNCIRCGRDMGFNSTNTGLCGDCPIVIPPFQHPGYVIQRATPVSVADLDDEPPCEWACDEDGIWHTDCDEAFVFIDDGPKEHRFVFCCYCGRTLNPKAYQEPESDDAVAGTVDEGKSVPSRDYEAVKAKAKREGVSMRALTLQLWKDWIDGNAADR